MLLPKTIANIQISPFNRPRSDRFSIRSGYLMTFPPAHEISDVEVEYLYCDHCPIAQYKVETINQKAGIMRRDLIRCAGRRMKHLGPIHISYECTPKKLDTFFMYGDTDTPCGIELDTLKQVVASSNFGLLDGVTRVGEI